MAITVHHLERSRSRRILWMLEELGLEYEIQEYGRDATSLRAPKELRDIHPLGKSPVLQIDDQVFAESAAIIEELAEREGKLRPEPRTEDFRRYRYFLHYAEGSLMPIFLVMVITGGLRSKRVPFLVRPIARGIAAQIDAAFTNRELDVHLPFLEAELSERAFFSGDAFTGADIQMTYPLEVAVVRAGIGNAYPNIQAYLAKLRARPAYQRAAERGGPLVIGGR